jgi:hypothetical protein
MVACQIQDSDRVFFLYDSRGSTDYKFIFAKADLILMSLF